MLRMTELTADFIRAADAGRSAPLTPVAELAIVPPPSRRLRDATSTHRAARRASPGGARAQGGRRQATRGVPLATGRPSSARGAEMPAPLDESATETLRQMRRRRRRAPTRSSWRNPPRRPRCLGRACRAAPVRLSRRDRPPCSSVARRRPVARAGRYQRDVQLRGAGESSPRRANRRSSRRRPGRGSPAFVDATAGGRVVAKCTLLPHGQRPLSAWFHW